MQISANQARTKADRVNSKESILDRILSTVEYAADQGVYDLVWPIVDHKEWIEDQLKQMGYKLVQLNNNAVSIEW